jgi:hypothetical protein
MFSITATLDHESCTPLTAANPAVALRLRHTALALFRQEERPPRGKGGCVTPRGDLAITAPFACRLTLRHAQPVTMIRAIRRAFKRGKWRTNQPDGLGSHTLDCPATRSSSVPGLVMEYPMSDAAPRMESRQCQPAQNWCCATTFPAEIGIPPCFDVHGARKHWPAGFSWMRRAAERKSCAPCGATDQAWRRRAAPATSIAPMPSISHDDGSGTAEIVAAPE